jgi:hypothetical protein
MFNKSDYQWLNVCSRAGALKLVTALLVKSRCGYDAEIVRELMKGNVRRWGPVLEDWCETVDR